MTSWVEVLDGLAQLNWYVGKHCLEVTEGTTCGATAFGIDSLLRDGVVDEDHKTPVCAVVHNGVELVAALCRDEAQDASVDVGCSFCGKLLPNVCGHCVDVAHHHVHIGEDVVVHALQHVVGFVRLGSLNFIGVVDESFAQRLNLADGSFVGKAAYDSC